jgi:hypothetical protein
VSNSALATAQNPQGTDITDISGTAIGNTTNRYKRATNIKHCFSETATVSGSGVLGDVITYPYCY